MVIRIRPLPVATRHSGRRLALAGLVLAAVLLGLVPALWSRSPTTLASARKATATVDQSLILRPQTTGIALRPAGGITVQGTLAPTIPGRNAVRLVVHTRTGAPVATGQVLLRATMLGMAMRPITAVLQARGGTFRGLIRLPMFGDYLLAVTLRSLSARYTGTTTVALPLPDPSR